MWWCGGGGGSSGRGGRAARTPQSSAPSAIVSAEIMECKRTPPNRRVVGNVLKEPNVALKFITKNSYKEFVSHNIFCLGTFVVLGNLYIVNLCGLEFLYSAFKQRETVQ